MGVEENRAIAVGLYGACAATLQDALAKCGFSLAGRTEDGATGLALLWELQPRLAVVSAVTAGLDGVAFARRARALRLAVQPDILLLRPRGLRLAGVDELSDLGVVALDVPLESRCLCDALAALARRPKSLPPEKAARLEALLDALGVPRHPGRECLSLAVTLTWYDARRLQSLKHGIYPELSLRTGLSAAQVERAMRHAIEVAWRTGEIDQQHRIFGDTIDARRGKPTCGEMIAQLAEELRWEA